MLFIPGAKEPKLRQERGPRFSGYSTCHGSMPLSTRRKVHSFTEEGAHTKEKEDNRSALNGKRAHDCSQNVERGHSVIAVDPPFGTF